MLLTDVVELTLFTELPMAFVALALLSLLIILLSTTITFCFDLVLVFYVCDNNKEVLLVFVFLLVSCVKSSDKGVIETAPEDEIFSCLVM